MVDSTQVVSNIQKAPKANFRSLHLLKQPPPKKIETGDPKPSGRSIQLHVRLKDKIAVVSVAIHEGAYPHLATKADLQAMQACFASLKTDCRHEAFSDYSSAMLVALQTILPGPS